MGAVTQAWSDFWDGIWTAWEWGRIWQPVDDKEPDVMSARKASETLSWHQRLWREGQFPDL